MFNEDKPISEYTDFERLLMKPGVKDAIEAMYGNTGRCDINFMLEAAGNMLRLAAQLMERAEPGTVSRDLTEATLNDADALARFYATSHGELATPWDGSAFKETIDRQRATINNAYAERNELVNALARLFPSGIRPTDIEGWDPEWNNCVYIDLPEGQISYHYHDREAHLFEDLPLYTQEYDGHEKVEVHERLRALAGFSGLVPYQWVVKLEASSQSALEEELWLTITKEAFAVWEKQHKGPLSAEMRALIRELREVNAAVQDLNHENLDDWATINGWYTKDWTSDPSAPVFAGTNQSVGQEAQAYFDLQFQALLQRIDARKAKYHERLPNLAGSQSVDHAPEEPITLERAAKHSLQQSIQYSYRSILSSFNLIAGQVNNQRMRMINATAIHWS